MLKKIKKINTDLTEYDETELDLSISEDIDFDNINNNNENDKDDDNTLTEVDDVDPDLVTKNTVVHVPISDNEQVKNILKQYDARYTNNPHFYTQLNKTLSVGIENVRDRPDIKVVSTPHLETLNEELFGEDQELINPFEIHEEDILAEEGEEGEGEEGEGEENQVEPAEEDMEIDEEEQDELDHYDSLIQARGIMEEEYHQKQENITQDIEKKEAAGQPIVDINAEQIKEALADFEDVLPKDAFNDPATTAEIMEEMQELYDPLADNADIVLPVDNPLARFDHLLNSPAHPLYGTALTRASEESRQYKEKVRRQAQEERAARESKRVYLTRKQTPVGIRFDPEYPPYYDLASERLLSYDPVLKRYTVDIEDSIKDHAREDQLFNDIFSKEEQELLAKHFTREEITSQLFSMPKDLLNDPLLFAKKFPALARDIDRSSEEFNERVSEHLSKLDTLEKDIKEIIATDGAMDVDQVDNLFNQESSAPLKIPTEQEFTEDKKSQFLEEQKEKEIKFFKRDMDEKFNQYLRALEDNENEYEEDILATAEAADYFTKFGKIQDPVPEELNFYGRDAYTKEQLRPYFFELSNRPTPQGKPSKPSNPTAHSLQGPLSSIPLGVEESLSPEENVDEAFNKKYEKYTQKQTFKLHKDAMYTFDPEMMKDYIQYKELAMPYQYTKLSEYMDNVELGIKNDPIDRVEQEREDIEDYFKLNSQQFAAKERKDEKRERLEKEYEGYGAAGSATGSSSSSRQQESKQQQEKQQESKQEGEEKEKEEKEEEDEEDEEENRQDDIAYDIDELDEDHQDVELFLDSDDEDDEEDDISIDESGDDRAGLTEYTDSTFNPTEYDSDYDTSADDYSEGESDVADYSGSENEDDDEYDEDEDDDSDEIEGDQSDYSNADKWNGLKKKSLIRGGDAEDTDDSDIDFDAIPHPDERDDQTLSQSQSEGFGDDTTESENLEQDMFWEIEDPKARLQAIKQFKRRDDISALTEDVTGPVASSSKSGSASTESSDLTEHVNMEGVEDLTEDDLTDNEVVYDTNAINANEHLSASSDVDYNDDDTDTEDLSEIPLSMREDLAPGDVLFLEDQAEITDSLFDDESGDDRTDFEDDAEFLDMDPKLLSNLKDSQEEKSMLIFNDKLYDKWGKEHKQKMASLTKEQIVEKLQAEYSKDLEEGQVGPNVKGLKYYQKIARNVLTPEEYQAYKQLKPSDFEENEDDLDDILDALDPNEITHYKEKPATATSSSSSSNTTTSSSSRSKSSRKSRKPSKYSEMEYDGEELPGSEELTDGALEYNTAAIGEDETIANYDEDDTLEDKYTLRPYEERELDNEGNEVEGVDFNFYNDKLNIKSARGLVQQENFYEEMELLDLMEGQYEQDFDYLRAEAEMYEKRNLKKLKLLEKRRKVAQEKKKAQMEHLKANPTVRLPYALPITQPAKEGVYKTVLAPPNSYVKLNPFTQPEDIKSKKVFDELINESYRALSSNPYYSVKQTKNSVEKIRKELSAANGNKKFRQHQLKHSKPVADPRLSKTQMLIHPDKLATFMPDYYAVEKEE